MLGLGVSVSVMVRQRACTGMERGPCSLPMTTGAVALVRPSVRVMVDVRVSGDDGRSGVGQSGQGYG